MNTDSLDSGKNKKLSNKGTNHHNVPLSFSDTRTMPALSIEEDKKNITFKMTSAYRTSPPLIIIIGGSGCDANDGTARRFGFWRVTFVRGDCNNIAFTIEYSYNTMF